MEKNTRVPAVALIAVLTSLTVTGCAANAPGPAYSFTHNIFGDELIPLSADPLSQGQ